MTDENTTPAEGRSIGDVTIGPDGVTRRGTFQRPVERERTNEDAVDYSPARPYSTVSDPSGVRESSSGDDVSPAPSAAEASTPGDSYTADRGGYDGTGAPVVTDHPVAGPEGDYRTSTADTGRRRLDHDASEGRGGADDLGDDGEAPAHPPVSAGSHAGASARAGGSPIATDDAEAPSAVAAPSNGTVDTGASDVAPAPVVAAAPVAAPAPPLAEAEAHAPVGTVPVALPGATGEVPRTIYVEAPTPPKKKGNRGIGILISLLATLVFTIVWAGVSAAVIAVLVPGAEFADSYGNFIANPAAWLPVITFFVGLVIIVSILNRAGWAWYIVGGLLVGLLAYVGYLAGALISAAGDLSPAEVQGFLLRAALNPLAIAVGITAREVSIWTGAAIAARGRRVKARNIEAREQFDRESAERRAEYERVRAGFGGV